MTIRVSLLCTALALLTVPALAASEPTTIVNQAPAQPAATAPAQVDRLTPAMVREFYEQGKIMHHKSLAEYKVFMLSHITDDVQFAMKMTNHVQGTPDQIQTLVLDKKKFEDSLDENYNMSQGAAINHRIEDVYIGADGKTGKVTDVTVMKKVVDMTKQGKAFKIEIQSQSTCEDIVVLGSNGLPQIKQSTCTAENYFTAVK